MSGVLGVLGEYRQCSFRGVPFAVIGSGGRNGRKTAVHDYPFRDTPKVEDLGRAGRGFRVRGFVCGTLFRSQFDLVLAAVEQAGPGLLIHPTRGVVNAAVLDFDWNEPDGIAGVIEFQFEFLEQRSLLSTTVLAAAQAVIAVASAALSTAASSDYAADTVAAYALGTAASGAAEAAASGWAGQAIGLSQTPAVTAAALAGLPTYYGRFVSGNAAVSSATATVTSALASVTVGQAAVALAVAAVGGTQDAADLATAVLAVPEALRNAVGDPGVQVQLLAQMATYAPMVVASTAPIGGAIATAQTAAAALCRRAALLSIALACSTYQPASYDDAQALRQQVALLFDPEIVSAADAGDGATFQTLRALRAQVLKDLANRASQLSRLITVTRGAPLPAPVLAQQLYADATRTPDLIRRADPIHPAFMPLSFEALAT